MYCVSEKCNFIKFVDAWVKEGKMEGELEKRIVKATQEEMRRRRWG
jgi:polyhydroxyalkanoate synthesis regulator phasin